MDTHESNSNPERTLYSEKQPVPVYWWILSLGLTFILGWQAQMQRNMIIGIAVGIFIFVAATWSLLHLSRSSVNIVEDSHGQRWLEAGSARLPYSAVAQTLSIPPSAKQNAMGRQLDPAAFVVHHNWVPSMLMIILDDPDDPTPYWLVSTSNPDELSRAFEEKQ